MNLAQRTQLLATAIGTAIKTLDLKVGEPSLLATDVKTNTVAAINELVEKQAESTSSIGDLSKLSTQSKGSLVSAINEIFGRTSAPGEKTDKVGNLQLLTTETKADVVTAINEVLAKANAANQSSLVGTSDDYNQATGLEELPDVWNGFTLMQAIGTLKTIVNHNSNLMSLTRSEVGSITGLQTANKTNIVDAINELVQKSADTSAITQQIQAAKQEAIQNTTDKVAALKSELLGGEGLDTALDTIKEIGEALKADKTTASAMAIQIGNRLKVDEVHNLTSEQLQNVYTSLNLGQPDTDFVAIFEAALQS